MVVASPFSRCAHRGYFKFSRDKSPALPIQICQAGGSVDLTNLITATPAGMLTFTLGTGITTSPSFDPTLVTATTTIAATYSGVCSATPVNFDIDVVPVGVITPPSAILNVCQSSGSQLLTSLVSATPSGGTFTFAGTGVTGSNFDPAGLTGNIVITVDYSIGGSCAAPQQTIIYTVLTNAGLTTLPTTTCPTGNVKLLDLVTANPAGGTFTFLGATGITGNLFDPSSHGWHYCAYHSELHSRRMYRQQFIKCIGEANRRSNMRWTCQLRSIHRNSHQPQANLR